MTRPPGDESQKPVVRDASTEDRREARLDASRGAWIILERAARDARYRNLLDLACTTFATDGFHKVLMDDLAHGVGVSKARIYRVVRGKNSLFAAVVLNEQFRLERAFADTLGTAPQSTDARTDSLFACVRPLFDYYAQHPYGFSLLFGSLNWKVEQRLHHAARDALHNLAQRSLELLLPLIAGERAAMMADGLITIAVAQLELAHERRISVVQARDMTLAFIASLPVVALTHRSPTEARKSSAERGRAMLCAQQNQ
ncbi:MAG: TetR/AcrR family transcriptional regulator [Solirubrobacteraceae bacterium]